MNMKSLKRDYYVVFYEYKCYIIECYKVNRKLVWSTLQQLKIKYKRFSSIDNAFKYARNNGYSIYYVGTLTLFLDEIKSVPFPNIIHMQDRKMREIIDGTP